MHTELHATQILKLLYVICQNVLKKYLSKYDVIIIGDFNIDVKGKTNLNFDKSWFCNTFSMSNLVKDYTYFTKTHKWGEVFKSGPGKNLWKTVFKKFEGLL